MASGINAPKSVHLRSRVSCQIVHKVVAHGWWRTEKMIKHSAVRDVHPHDTSRPRRALRLSISTMAPPEEYPIIKMGMTISFAGSPRRNAARMKPSRPMAFPRGPSAVARRRRRLAP
jgi:hypothetical protein